MVFSTSLDVSSIRSSAESLCLRTAGCRSSTVLAASAVATASRLQYPEGWAGGRMQLSPCQQIRACAFSGPSFPSPRPAVGSRTAADDVQPISRLHNADVGCDCRSHRDHKLCFSSPCHYCPRRPGTACQKEAGVASRHLAAKTVFLSFLR